LCKFEEGILPERLPPLVPLRAFEAVGRLGGLRAASEALSVHHTVVGRHVRKLEDWLGAKLVDSSFSETRLTPAGKVYYDQISEALQLISDATYSLRPAAGQQVRIWCGPGLNIMWLMPRLQQISEAISTEVVLLRATDHLPDFRRYEADIAIHYGREYVPNSTSVDLLLPRMLAVASPDFVARHGPLQTPADLVDVPLIHEQTWDWWQKWFRANNVPVAGPIGGPRLGYSHVAIEAAILGNGVALANELLVSPDLAAGRLVEVAPTQTYFDPYVFYAAKARWNEPAIARLRNLLLRDMEVSV
jgi:LysR family glycine cleavage system transcriptional activator